MRQFRQFVRVALGVMVLAGFSVKADAQLFRRAGRRADLIVTGNVERQRKFREAQIKARGSEILERTDSSIRFTVDLDLPEPESLRYAYSGDRIIGNILENRGDIVGNNVLASSFGKDTLVGGYGKTAFFSGMIDAFAYHYPVTLSPDVIWLLICQGFAHYVNDDPEAVRNLFVDHDGKAALVVESKYDLISMPDSVDWSSLLQGFADQIRANTKNGIADIMLADFSTTGPTERIVSQATLMETMKSYFEYVVFYASCGIPYITLEGTTHDWEQVLEKARRLSAFGMDWWFSDLDPILQQFVAASRGEVDASFWQNIVKKYRPGDIRGGGCSPDRPTEFDGWFLKLLPFDENGRTPKSATRNHKMASEISNTSFKYLVMDNVTGAVVGDFSMELCSGIVSMEQDPETYAMKPKLGWFVRMDSDNSETVGKLDDMSGRGDVVWLKVKSVPEAFRNLTAIRELTLEFLGEVEIPEWMDSIEFGYLSIRGDMTQEQVEALKKRFPNAYIFSTSVK